jgi:hypothetical protein
MRDGADGISGRVWARVRIDICVGACLGSV